MNDNLLRIRAGNRNITLIGTAHVSKESIAEVDRIIREEKPGVVCVELDEGRYASISEKDNWEKLNVTKVLREGKGFLLIANLVLSGFQRRLGNELGIKPGEEMKTAAATAKELGIPFTFCDREVQTTLRRAWARCDFWNKSKLLASLFSGAFTTEKLTGAEIENLKKKSELDGMMSELAEYLPPVKETLIDERDRYLAAKIWTSVKGLAADGNEAGAAAVVGAGHLTGVKAHLEKMAGGEEDADVSQLDVIPPPGFLSKAAGWIIPLLIVALIAAGFLHSGADASVAMLLRWVLWNGSLAALGSLLALAHPLAILVSFAGAPIATLNPFIGVGLFSGFVQACMRKPRVEDAENINENISSLKGIYHNRILRVLLVFLLSSLGGIAGNVISIPGLAGQLFK
ncbi:MAG: TraB/GumN family protein [Treponema sp.]|jgi:pheromone shutdown-related protein TraB|nr:TraB/GumN family protein [Treponema sp.]